MQDSRPKEFEERESIRIYQSVRLDRWAFELPTINKRIKPMLLRAGLVSATDRCLQELLLNNTDGTNIGQLCHATRLDHHQLTLLLPV